MKEQPRSVVAVVQARTSSSRLPGKVLADLAGAPVLAWVVRAAQAIPGVDQTLVATSEDDSDDAVADWCRDSGVRCIRGPLEDVLARYVMALDQTGADIVVRVTGDCPFLDPAVSGQVVALQKQTGCALATNADGGTWPDGLDTEVLSAEALRVSDAEATKAVEREHATPFVKNRRARFDLYSLPCPIPGIQHHRWTLDDAEDLAYLRAIAAELPGDRVPSFVEVLDIVDRHPDLLVDRGTKRNERYAGVVASRGRSNDYTESQRYLARALRTIPTAAQTFSKSAAQWPEGHTPLFLTHGLNGRVWDLDGNEFVDMVCGLLAVSIGYREPTIDAATRHQLDRGVSFSLPSRLEAELAEKIVELVPSAEAVRFGKNGTDATSAAVRLARAYTGRDHVIACGYHGWQDWYIGSTTRASGVPGAVQALTHSVRYNDLQALTALFDEISGQVAAIIMEPATFERPDDGYLEKVRDLAHRHGSLLVFDEIVTGFRFSLGGAQEMFGVTPDLVCLGKGLGNGLPIAVVAGRSDVMQEVENVFVSGTFGGEALSLAASLAVVDMMRNESVIPRLWDAGDMLANAARDAVKRHNLTDAVSVRGWSPWTLLDFSDFDGARKAAIRTLFIREMLTHGVLTLGTANVCYRHNDRDIAHVSEAYDAAFARIAAELASGDLEARLGHPAIEPVFHVRKPPAAA